MAVTARREDYVGSTFRPTATRDDPAAADRGDRVSLFEIAEPSLEEIFIEHVGRRAVDEAEEHLATTGKSRRMSGLLPNALHVARREYLVRVRGRAFKVTTAVLALLVIGVIFLPTILAAAGVDEPPRSPWSSRRDDVRFDHRGRVGRVRPRGPRGRRKRPGRRRGRPSRGGAGGPRRRLRRLAHGRRTEDGELAFEFLGSASPTNQIRQAASAAASGSSQAG